MNDIRYPWMRAQFIDFVQGLADFSYQREHWQEFHDTEKEYDELDFTVHFFYDDTKLASDPESVIGSCLYDCEEAELVRSIVSALDIVFDKYELELKDKEYLEKPEWQAVVQAAIKALPVLEANGIGSWT